MDRFEHLPADYGLEGNTAVLMVSCAKYAQLWEPFSILFKRYWPDCPYPIYAGVDSGDVPDIQTIHAGTDMGLNHNCLFFLGNIPNVDRVILFQDDFLLTGAVDTVTVRRLVRLSRDRGIGCLRICPCPGPSMPWEGGDLLGMVCEKDEYRVSFQLAIWHKEVLARLLAKTSSPWDLEQNGHIYSSGFSEPFLSVWRKSPDEPGGPVPYFITGVTRGRWTPGVLSFLAREGITVAQGPIT